eukprot:4187800-Amphidinium_carterae.1
MAKYKLAAQKLPQHSKDARMTHDNFSHKKPFWRPVQVRGSKHWYSRSSCRHAEASIPSGESTTLRSMLILRPPVNQTATLQQAHVAHQCALADEALRFSRLIPLNPPFYIVFLFPTRRGGTPIGIPCHGFVCPLKRFAFHSDAERVELLVTISPVTTNQIPLLGGNTKIR